MRELAALRCTAPLGLAAAAVFEQQRGDERGLQQDHGAADDGDRPVRLPERGLPELHHRVGRNLRIGDAPAVRLPPVDVSARWA